MNQEELSKILELHKTWIDSNGEHGIRAYLQYAYLQYADLRGADLRRTDLQGVDLRGADLRRTDLQGADLRGANLWGADLRRTDFQGADLRGANLWGADLRGANLYGANLQGANLDFSCWPLYCGSKGVKVDVEFVKQLAMHIGWLDCPEAKNFIEICRVYSLNSEVRKRNNLGDK
jgi:uncharacterized protein YjbI with pentapeptide repeats